MSFYKTEIRTMQIMHKDDNDAFLTMVANLLQNITTERDELRHKVGMLEHEIRCRDLGDDFDHE
jgi:hypothetical protein